MIVAGLLFFSGCRDGLRRGWQIRIAAFYEVGKRAEPLIAAINAFTTASNRPPAMLEDLVPGFLPKLPETGLGAAPHFRYRVCESDPVYAGNSWMLELPAGSGGINFDSFIYFPNQQYPTHGFGGWLERVGDWAYVHE